MGAAVKQAQIYPRQLLMHLIHRLQRQGKSNPRQIILKLTTRRSQIQYWDASTQYTLSLITGSLALPQPPNIYEWRLWSLIPQPSNTEFDFVGATKTKCHNQQSELWTPHFTFTVMFANIIVTSWSLGPKDRQSRVRKFSCWYVF